MSSLKFVLDVGVNFLTGGTGKVLEAGLGTLLLPIPSNAWYTVIYSG